VAGTLLPSIAAGIGHRVQHVVFLAGITAPPGVLPLEVFLPGHRAAVEQHLARLRRTHAGETLEMIGDVKTATAIDSLNFSTQPMAWPGRSPMPRATFVRCAHDQIQTPEVQSRFIEHSRAGPGGRHRDGPHARRRGSGPAGGRPPGAHRQVPVTSAAAVRVQFLMAPTAGWRRAQLLVEVGRCRVAPLPAGRQRLVERPPVGLARGLQRLRTREPGA
jgi:hypothetical protein